MNTRRAFRIGALSFVAAVAGANYLPSSCAYKKPVVEPGPQPTDPLQDQVDRLNDINPGYALEKNDLVALTRMLYFEDKFDPKFNSDAEQSGGYAAIAEVIKNRYLFDMCAPEAPVQNPTCGRDKPHTQYDGHDGLIGIITREHNGVHQFSSLSQYAPFFTPESLGQGLYDSSFGTQERHQIDLAYGALIGVLDGSISPETHGALYYKNTDVTNRKNGHLVKWDDEKAFDDTELDCSAITHVPSVIPGEVWTSAKDVKCRVERPFDHQYDLTIGSHDYYTVEEDADERTEFVWYDGHKYVDGVLHTPQSKVPVHQKAQSTVIPPKTQAKGKK